MISSYKKELSGRCSYPKMHPLPWQVFRYGLRSHLFGILYRTLKHQMGDRTGGTRWGMSKCPPSLVLFFISDRKCFSATLSLLRRCTNIPLTVNEHLANVLHLTCPGNLQETFNIAENILNKYESFSYICKKLC